MVQWGACQSGFKAWMRSRCASYLPSRTEFTGGERALYQFIETSSEVVANTTLGSVYRQITYWKGNDATP